jgi:hypothetical protein
MLSKAFCPMTYLQRIQRKSISLSSLVTIFSIRNLYFLSTSFKLTSLPRLLRERNFVQTTLAYRRRIPSGALYSDVNTAGLAQAWAGRRSRLGCCCRTDLMSWCRLLLMTSQVRKWSCNLSIDATFSIYWGENRNFCLCYDLNKN